jgi:hypothetical protein
MKYSTVTEEQLDVLQQGLDLLAHVSHDLLPSTLYLYGLLKPDSPILSSITEAAWEDNYAGEAKENDIQIETAAVSIRLSSDILQYLLGSGFRSEDDDFEYLLNEEAHASSFSYTDNKPVISLSQFSKVALADDSYWLRDFLQAEGATQEQQHPSVITRTTPAPVPDEASHGGAEEVLHAQHPHQSSRKPFVGPFTEEMIDKLIWKNRLDT